MVLLVLLVHAYIMELVLWHFRDVFAFPVGLEVIVNIPTMAINVQVVILAALTMVIVIYPLVTVFVLLVIMVYIVKFQNQLDHLVPLVYAVMVVHVVRTRNIVYAQKDGQEIIAK